MKQHLDNIVGFFAGMSGFLLNITFLQTGIWWFDIIKAGATALVCGFLGVAGKHLFTALLRRLKK